LNSVRKRKRKGESGKKAREKVTGKCKVKL
jgi:hypothetical protein